MSRITGLLGSARAPAGATRAALLALLTAGCALHDHVPTSVTVASQDKAGKLLITPTMVGPWADVSGSLNPKFVLTGDQALTQVLPVTETINQQVLSAVGFGLAAGLPTSSTSGSNTLTKSLSDNSSSANGIVTTTSSAANGSSSTTTTATAPGVAPSLPTGTPAGGALPGNGGAPPALGLSSIERYREANNLFQEVQLLNQEVSNTANRDCYVPYVVRLALKVIPYRPHVAYSVHSKIAFFLNGSYNTTLPPVGEDQPPSARWNTNPDVKYLDPPCQRALSPAVVPFLVSDDMEIAVKARAAEAATQIATALSFMVHGVGASAQFNAVKQSLTAISNHDFSSSLTVGRDADNTLDAVISANNVASGEPSLVNKPYYVAALLLVPRAYFGGRINPSPVVLSLRSFTEFRDARTGEILPQRDETSLDQRGAPLVKPMVLPQYQNSWDQLGQAGRLELLHQLMDAVTSGDPDAFWWALKNQTNFGAQYCKKADGLTPTSCFNTNQDRAASLWPAIAGLNEDSPTKIVPFEAPLPTPIKLDTQQVLLNDDGTHPIQAVLAGVEARSATNLEASLNVTPYTPDEAGGGKAGTKVSIAATSLVLVDRI